MFKATETYKNAKRIGVKEGLDILYDGIVIEYGILILDSMIYTAQEKLDEAKERYNLIGVSIAFRNEQVDNKEREKIFKKFESANGYLIGLEKVKSAFLKSGVEVSDMEIKFFDDESIFWEEKPKERDND